MSANLYSVGPMDPYLPNENTEETRKHRRRGLEILKKLGLIQIILGIGTLTIGIVSLVFGVENGGHFPFVMPFPIVAGILALVGGFLAYCSHTKVQNIDGNEQLTMSGKCLVIGSYAIFITNITFGGLSMAFSVVGLVICNSSDLIQLVKCLPKNDESMIAVGLAIAAGLLVCLFSICGTCVFCCFGRAFGFKSRYERAMLAGMRMAQLQQAQQAQATGGGQISAYNSQWNTNYSQKLQTSEPNYR